MTRLIAARSGANFHSPRSLSRARGFTIIELMIVITILAIFIMLAAPSMGNLVRDQRIKTATGDVYATLAFARSEALKRNTNVAVIPTSGDWAGGWHIEKTDDGTVLKNQDALEGISVTQADGSNIGTVTYRGDGRLTAAVPDIVLKWPGSTTVTVRCVRLNLSGLPNVKVDTNSAVDGCQ